MACSEDVAEGAKDHQCGMGLGKKARVGKLSRKLYFMYAILKAGFFMGLRFGDGSEGLRLKGYRTGTLGC